MSSILDLFDAQVHYTPVWVNGSNEIGTGFPYKTLSECEAFFERRVNEGIDDKAYKIKVSNITYGPSKIKPLGQEKET